jgi:CheY-like chemotaxis protein
MPGHDGYWLLNEIRTRKPKLRVAAMTALNASDERLRVAGFDSLLRKPIDPERLRDLL